MRFWPSGNREEPEMIFLAWAKRRVAIFRHEIRLAGRFRPRTVFFFKYQLQITKTNRLFHERQSLVFVRGHRDSAKRALPVFTIPRSIRLRLSQSASLRLRSRSSDFTFFQYTRNSSHFSASPVGGPDGATPVNYSCSCRLFPANFRFQKLV